MNKYQKELSEIYESAGRNMKKAGEHYGITKQGFFKKIATAGLKLAKKLVVNK